MHPRVKPEGSVEHVAGGGRLNVQPETSNPVQRQVELQGRLSTADQFWAEEFLCIDCVLASLRSG